MNIEASPVSETTIQDASVLESCVQRKFAPAPIWTKAMLAALQGLKEVNAFFADLGLFTMSEAHKLARQSR